MKRLFIIHGWEGSADEPLYQSLKKELESQDWKVFPLPMPNSEEPKIDEWVPFLANAVKTADQETYFYGHSIGSQTILRYLETLPENIKVGGVIFTAGWVHLIGLDTPEEEGSMEIAKPWLETPLNWDKIKSHCNKWVTIFSDNDPYVPLSDKDIFKEELNAEIIVEHNKDHAPGSDIVMNKILEISK
jgi:uncharacterized protein